MEDLDINRVSFEEIHEYHNLDLDTLPDGQYGIIANVVGGAVAHIVTPAAGGGAVVPLESVVQAGNTSTMDIVIGGTAYAPTSIGNIMEWSSGTTNFIGAVNFADAVTGPQPGTGDNELATILYVNNKVGESNNFLQLSGGTMDASAKIKFDSYIYENWLSFEGLHWKNPGGETDIRQRSIVVMDTTTAISWDNDGHVGIKGSPWHDYALGVNGKGRFTDTVSVVTDPSSSSKGLYIYNNKSGSDVVAANIKAYTLGGTIELIKTTAAGVYTGYTFDAYNGQVGINREYESGYALSVDGKGKFTGAVELEDSPIIIKRAGHIFGMGLDGQENMNFDHDTGGNFQWRDGNSSNAVRMKLDIDTGKLTLGTEEVIKTNTASTTTKITSMWTGTQSQYDSISPAPTSDNGVLYVIKG